MIFIGKMDFGQLGNFPPYTAVFRWLHCQMEGTRLLDWGRSISFGSNPDPIWFQIRNKTQRTAQLLLIQFKGAR
jgi:hypothetical protein